MALLPDHDPRITSEAASLLHHTLGMQDHTRKSKWGYRNYFAESKGATRYKDEFEALLGLGFMSSRESKNGPYSSYICYFATEAGAEAVGLHPAGMKRAGLNPSRRKAITQA